MHNHILFDVNEKIATLTFNRPEKFNAFTDEMIQALVESLDSCQAREDVNVIVLTGAGDTFCSGGDVEDFANRAARTPAMVKKQLSETTQRLPKKIIEMEKPTIAAINGLAYGAGLDIAMMCDLRFASQEAKLAEVYARMGLVPGAGGAWLLPRLVGTSRALEMLWTTESITGLEAERIGLVNRAFPKAELMKKTYEVAHKIANGASLAIRGIKKLVYHGLETNFITSLEHVASNMPLTRASSDHQEAITAFKEKRKPRFTGN